MIAIARMCEYKMLMDFNADIPVYTLFQMLLSVYTLIYPMSLSLTHLRAAFMLNS